MLSSESLKHIREQREKIDAILDIIKNEPLYDKMTIISMIIDSIASTHNTSCLELWSVMYNTAFHVYMQCGEMEGNDK